MTSATIRSTRSHYEAGNVRLFTGDQARTVCPEVSEILDFFDRQTGGRRFARRADILPRHLARYMKNMMILDLSTGPDGTLTDMIFRYLGVSLVEIYGEITGKSIFDLLPNEAQKRILRICQKTYDERQPVALFVQAFSIEKRYINMRGVNIPLSENNRDIDRMLGFALPLISDGETR